MDFGVDLFLSAESNASLLFIGVALGPASLVDDFELAADFFDGFEEERAVFFLLVGSKTS